MEIHPRQRTNKYLVRFLITIAIIGILLSIVILSVKDTVNQQNPTITKACGAAPINADGTCAFIQTSIKQLTQTLDSNNGTYPNISSIVQLQGTILQKTTLHFPASKGGGAIDYIKIVDSGGYAALVMLETNELNFPTLFNQFTIGETVTARGMASVSTCGGGTNADPECNALNITQFWVPVIYAMEPMPEFGNKEPIENISK